MLWYNENNSCSVMLLQVCSYCKILHDTIEYSSITVFYSVLLISVPPEFCMSFWYNFMVDCSSETLIA